MSWGLLIAPHSAASYTQGIVVRGRAAARAPQSRHKGRGLMAFAILAIMSGTNSARAQQAKAAPLHTAPPPTPRTGLPAPTPLILWQRPRIAIALAPATPAPAGTGVNP